MVTTQYKNYGCVYSDAVLVSIYQTTRLHIPEDHGLDIYGRENLKSHMI
jgi:hypothetical protein